MKIHPMWHEYPTLAPELASALTLIEKQITTNNTPVAKAIMEMINGGGKLLRPAYCLLFSRFQDTDREKMIALAAAIETLHTATLIHDDIIDNPPQSGDDSKTIRPGHGSLCWRLSFCCLLQAVGTLRLKPPQHSTRQRQHGENLKRRTGSDGHTLSNPNHH